jgi:hypothetical protein
VLGALLGASFGLIMNFAAFAVTNVVHTNYNVLTPFILLIPYALMGVVGTIISERTRPRAQALLG